MTALNFFITPDEICFATDTLALGAEDRTPSSFITKFAILPHLRTAVTGTGNNDFVSRWLDYVRGHVVALDVEHLNVYCPEAMRDLATRCDLEGVTVTIYHFGLSLQRDRFLGYAYRSTADFEAEVLLEGLGIKPPVEPPDGDLVFPDAFIDLMKRQQEEDRARQEVDRVGIGGEIHYVHLYRAGFSIATIHRFASHAEEYHAICERLGTAI